jgi:tryptophan halogenase
MKRIVIVGGGTAGWLTALVVNKFWKDTSVTLIESSKIGILGAGEGSTPNFGRMLSLLDIDQKEFFNRTNSTIKSGLHFYNWVNDNELSKHMFFEGSFNEINKTNAYHFDARLVARYFKEIAITRGVEWIDGEILNFKHHDDQITALDLNDNRQVELDFIFDCSGFSKIIIDGVHKEKWKDYSEFLILNKSINFFLPQKNEYNINDKTQTKMISMNNGWMFNIPLQHRWGCGYVHSSKHCSIDEAKKEVEEYFGHEIKVEKVFDFNPGSFERSWIGNSISIGLSYGFIEPLEATSLMSTIMQLKRLIDFRFNETYKEKYNRWCREIYEQNLLFIRYHYLCERNDTQFWRDCTSQAIPLKLKKVLDKNNSITVSTDMDLLRAFELEETSPNELTFFVNNYLTIFRKNKKKTIKELI